MLVDYDLSYSRIIDIDELSCANEDQFYSSTNDINALLKRLKNREGVTSIRLEGNSFSVAACDLISRELIEFQSLKRLIMNNCFTTRAKAEIPPCLRFIGEGLIGAGCVLTELNFSDNAFGPIGIENLENLLKSKCCEHLKELRLNNNGLGPEGTSSLANILLESDCRSLRVFICGRNRVENKGAFRLGKMFNAMKHLQEIQIIQNGINHEGLVSIIKSIGQLPNIRVINLSDNTFKPETMTTLCSILSHIPTIESILINDCCIENDMTYEMVRAFQKNKKSLKNLNSLSLAGNEFTQRAVDGGLLKLTEWLNVYIKENELPNEFYTSSRAIAFPDLNENDELDDFDDLLTKWYDYLDSQSPKMDLKFPNNTKCPTIYEIVRKRFPDNDAIEKFACIFSVLNPRANIINYIMSTEPSALVFGDSFEYLRILLDEVYKTKKSTLSMATLFSNFYNAFELVMTGLVERSKLNEVSLLQFNSIFAFHLHLLHIPGAKLDKRINNRTVFVFFLIELIDRQNVFLSRVTINMLSELIVYELRYEKNLKMVYLYQKIIMALIKSPEKTT
ncbi:hypothetical protein SNEBB_007153 [Seison nebaliae]|nr:hypothetical protein SNEBB_007153 [Seison nebaliae]